MKKTNQKVVAVIPARYASTRFPGKPLAMINGRPMLEWVILAAQKSPSLDEVIVATDHLEIQKVAEKLCQVVMTSSDLPSGSDRVWSAVKDRDVDIVVNIQGDEPLLKPESLELLVKPLLIDVSLEMSTLGHPISQEELLSENAVKVLVNKNKRAIYFSRFPIPYSREKKYDSQQHSVLKHIGLYAYRADFLKKYCATPVSFMERAEGLEQLRALDLGGQIFVSFTEHQSWGVDTPEDIIKVEEMMGASHGQKI